jgi:hypothetical protein
MDWFSVRIVFPMGTVVMLICTLIFFIGSGRRLEATAGAN